MNWILLFVAGLCEVLWAVALKYSEGWTRLWPSIIAIVGCVVSIILLSFPLKTMPAGSAYAIWVGIGIIGVALWGIFYFGESASLPRLLCIGLILVGVLGLKLIKE